MLSSADIERLIAEKRREIEQEKTILGLAKSPMDIKIENADQTEVPKSRRVKFTENVSHDETEDKKERDGNTGEAHGDLDERIPPDLERYIRRYIGLPVMLKAGEYSPNNPLIRAERTSGDVLLGLGEYERRRNTLRKLRQQQYREYLDEQAKKKQEEKARAERDRREREEKERLREERERQIELERERERELERDRHSPRHASVGCGGNTPYYTKKVDTGVQVDCIRSPLSVAVQTDDDDLFQLPSPKSKLTQAERELSPRTALPEQRSPRPWTDRRPSDDEGSLRPSRQSLPAAIFDADAIHLRNLQAEKEAAERRQFYQQELKNQIQEQQRIKEERKTREKMLEQAEMRRLEEQLRMLKMAHEKEVTKQKEISAAINAENVEYTNKRKQLQNVIDLEKSLLRAPVRVTTSHSDSYNPSKLPFYYPRFKDNDKPYSMNIPDHSIFSPNYDVDSYLRKNLNYKSPSRFDAKNDVFGDKIANRNKDFNFDGSLYDLRNASKKIRDNFDDGNLNNANKDVFDDETHVNSKNNHNFEDGITKNIDLDVKSARDYKDKKVVIEKAIIHEPRNVKLPKLKSVQCDDIPIPVLRHSPLSQTHKVENDLSDAMQLVDDKWKVPAVQKNILKSLPNEEGKKVSILTQLGSIRRQLQLEQLKLDKMGKGDS